MRAFVEFMAWAAAGFVLLLAVELVYGYVAVRLAYRLPRKDEESNG